MSKKLRPVVLAAFVAVVAVLIGLHSAPAGVDAWTLAARFSARSAFPFLMIAYSASSMVKLWPNKVTRYFMRNRKWWGLGFATAQTVHLFAVYNFLQVSPQPAPPTILLGGGFVYAVLYAMVLTSWKWAYKAMGQSWKWLHTFGIHLLWLVFAFAYGAKAVTRPDQLIPGIALLTVALGGLYLRYAAHRYAEA
jgi:sulfoxide reductase heme-binding subunit YedZ